LGRKNVYISLWWLKVLWFVYCWMFLMDVGYRSAPNNRLIKPQQNNKTYAFCERLFHPLINIILIIYYWLKVLWFVYCWMFLMDVGYIQYYYQRVWLPGHWLFWKEGQAFVFFSFHLVASSRSP
jgi:hypothetical protein